MLIVLLYVVIAFCIFAFCIIIVLLLYFWLIVLLWLLLSYSYYRFYVICVYCAKYGTFRARFVHCATCPARRFARVVAVSAFSACLRFVRLICT